MTNSTIHQARTEDASEGCDVVRKSILTLCAADHNEDEQLIQAWLANKTAQNFVNWIGAPGALSFIARTSHSAVGFALATSDGELTLLYVAPEAHRKGIGRALLTAVETMARNAALTQLRVDSTLTARDFYLRNRFSLIGAPSSVWGLTSYPMRKQLNAT
jgi:GNAT superfamily N-acetyltransferase